MKYYLSIVILILFYGCSTNIPTLAERTKTALQIDTTLEKKYRISQNFNLFSLQKVSNNCNNIRIYIEGDGLSWVNRNQISNNPTPINPIGLKIMKNDISNCKIYLARPCQYINSFLCEKEYWTSARFNSKIIQSYIEILTNIKKEYNNNSFTLIGYSGGAAVALITAAKRDDIKKVITIAGNLNHTKWTQIHQITPLSDSLNPIDFTKSLKDIQQIHIIGKRDYIIPKEVTNSFLNNFSGNLKVRLITIDSDHTCCFLNNYSEFNK